ncbi:MAG: bifunctional 3-(3-hydroxy-phenyl)propionate/3-hydroxycinnamic acid hydroxylase [Hyphomonadaceae bacterium]|nr:bifunctional 3-(3-hydroxy-phenyl)propionate/3-hydroxycinnamic acid hydroxylase [Hyphomonadaceae bacterium]
MVGDVEVDVLVVGAGPVGVSLGALLAQAGVTALVIDKEADIYPLPRAAHVDHEIMRIFQAIGVADEVAASSRTPNRYDFLNADGEVLLRFEGADRLGPGGWSGGNMIHQPSIEMSLRKAAMQLPDFRLKTSCTWVSSEEHGDTVVSRVRGADGEQSVRSCFVVGCDGARSPVREAASIELDDLQFDEPWLVIDTLVRDAERLPKINLQICDPARPTTCVLMGSGRHRWEFMLKPGETAEQMLDDQVIAGLLSPWNVEGAINLERKAVYRFNAKVAKAWRKGRTLLAGDAAHLMPPFAGQGLCSGLRDAANLAWKLAAIKRGANDSLLDTYQLEREPHIRAIIGTAIMMGRTVCITDPAAARVRDQQMLAARAATGAAPHAPANPPMAAGCIMGGPPAGAYFPQFVSGAASSQRFDDALGAGAWLIARTAVATVAGGPRGFALADIRLDPYRDQLLRWLDKHAVEAVLVRPDRYIFGAGEPHKLLAAWATQLK